MPALRRLLVAVAFLAALAGAAAHGSRAANPPPDCSSPPTVSDTLSGPHFDILYQSDSSQPGYIDQSQAGAILAAAENAWTHYVADGFPAPAVDPLAGKTEFYITDLSQFHLGAVYSTGCAVLDATSVTGDLAAFEVGTDVFTQITQQLGGVPQYMTNGIAAWASWRALGYPSDSIADLGPFDLTLDCDSLASSANCSKQSYENLGGSRWPFYEYLTENYGPLFIENLVSAVSSLGDLAGLDSALMAKGSSLTAAYDSYATKLLSGTWTATTLNAATVPVSGSKIQTGSSSGAIPSESFGINHLATKFVEIDRGDGDGSHPCYTATLTLKVQIPAGVTSQPAFVWANGGSAPVALTVSGNTASTTIHGWDTCKWSSHGYLAIPNASDVDGVTFVVSGSLSVDYTKPAASALPPAQTSQSGLTYDAGTFSPVPGISLYGPDALQLASTAAKLRLIVGATGEGSVTVKLGSSTLGTAALVTGTNDLRFTLPAGLRRSLRRTAGTLLLTLTPVAPDGTTKGIPVTAKVSIAAAPAKKKLERRK